MSGISSFQNHFVSHFSERKTLFPRTLIPDMTAREYQRTTELIVLYCNEENLLDDIPTLVDILKP